MTGSVLIGEDNLISQQVMEALLEAKCEKVKAVGGYKDLMEELGRERYDLLFLDYHLDQDADFIVAKLRAGDSANKDIPIFILSAEPEIVVLEKMRGLAISGYIKKPIDSRMLETALQRTFLLSGSEKSDPFTSTIDLSALEVLLGGKTERVQKIIEIFMSETLDYFNQMEYLLAEKDWPKLKALVHRRRASYGYLGLDALNELLRKWEADIEARRNQDQYNLILNRIKSETAVVLGKLEKIFPSNS